MSWQICCARDNACVRWQLGFHSAEARRVCDGVSAVDAATRWEQGDSSSGKQRRADEERGLGSATATRRRQSRVYGIAQG